jgi:hypothetical protein
MMQEDDVMTDAHFNDIDFSADYQRHYGKSEYSYGEILPAYRYGWDRAHEGTYRGHTWNDAIEISLRRRWKRNSSLPWQAMRPAIHEGYERAQMSLSGPPGSIGPAPTDAAITLDEPDSV